MQQHWGRKGPPSKVVSDTPLGSTILTVGGSLRHPLNGPQVPKLKPSAATLRTKRPSQQRCIRYTFGGTPFSTPKWENPCPQQGTKGTKTGVNSSALGFGVEKIPLGGGVSDTAFAPFGGMCVGMCVFCDRMGIQNLQRGVQEPGLRPRRRLRRHK